MRTLLTLCAVILSLTAFSTTDPTIPERNGSITGRVIDVTLNEPIPYVNVIIKDTDDTIITGGITDFEGNFTIEKIPEGNIIVEVTYIGYKTVRRTITIAKGNYDINLGQINLEEASENLDEVTIVAETTTIQQKIDRKVITVGKDLTTTGPTASDIMNNLPSVSVDQQSGNISLRGNQNVQVMVDGKLTNIAPSQLLRQIPSNSIKQIELITNPSAKYNPDGLSGIINIILHKNVNIGFNGTVRAGLNYMINPRFNSSLDMNYRNGKLNFFGNYSNNVNRQRNYGNITRLDDNSIQRFQFEDRGVSHLAKVGLDYYINDKNTISIFTNQNIFDGENSGTTNILFQDPMNNEFQNIYAENENDSQQYNFNYKLDFDKEGHNVELEVDHNIFDGRTFADNDFLQLNDFEEINNIERNRTTINLDYVNPLTETSKLEVGVQARLFDNNIDYFSDARLRDQLGNPFPADIRFDYSRNIYSAYASYGKNFDKWSYQIGVRAETVNVDSEAFQTNLNTNAQLFIPFENDYTELYPSAFFTYTPSEINSYQLSYSRRIDRPGVGQVNPLPEWNTPLISSFGNQALLPQFTNSLEVNYTRKLEKGSVTAGAFFRVIEDEINRAVLIDRADLNRIILTFDNFDNTTAYGIEVNSNYRPTKWWSLNGSFDLFAQTQKSISEVLDVPTNVATEADIRRETIEVDNIIWNFRVFNNFKVSNRLSFSAFYMYRGLNRTIQFDVSPMSMLNLGMRYSFLEDNRATFSLTFNDIFDSMFFDFEGERPFAQVGGFNWENQTIFGELSYRFGGSKYRAKSRKRRDNDEKSGGGGFL